MDRLVFVCFIALVAVAPVPFGGAPHLAQAGLGLAAGLLALAFAAAELRRPGRIGPPAARTWWLVAGFALLLAWGLAQSLPLWPEAARPPAWRLAGAGGGAGLTPDAAAAGDVLLRLLASAAVFWLALHYGRDSQRARVLLWSLIASATLIAAYGMVMQFSGLKLVLWWPRDVFGDSVTGTFVNRNHFATYAGLLGVAALAVLLRRLSAIGGEGLGLGQRLALTVDSLGRSGWAALTATLLLLAAVLLSASRAGTVASLVGLLLVFLGFMARPGARPLPWLAGLAALLLVATGGLALVGETLLLRAGDGGALAGRLEVTHASLAALAERPLSGFGLGSFPALFESFRSPALAQDARPYLHAHNTYVELAAEAGWPAFLLLQALLLGCAWRCWRGLRQRRHDWLYGLIALAAGGVAAVHAAFDFSLQLPGVTFPLAALLGLGVAQSWRHEPGGSASSGHRRARSHRSDRQEWDRPVGVSLAPAAPSAGHRDGPGDPAARPAAGAAAPGDWRR